MQEINALKYFNIVFAISDKVLIREEYCGYFEKKYAN